ncbi:hypothetical protein AUG86_01795 [Euryarchaeota archaeon 13_1_20CM_4_64_14]|nr:MAG: hypothetical protein AUG86_01795 [Euryarchaeota archaeon 13_1_20CM_4_64_14]
MKAVYGGSKSLIDRVALHCMFGTTYPILDASELVNEYDRMRAWVNAVRATPGGPIESGLVYRATCRERIL